MANTQLEIGVVGVPLWKGQPKPGVDQGPTAIRETGVLKRLQQLGHSVNDHGDLKFTPVTDDPPYGNIKTPRAVGSMNEKISEKISTVVQSGESCLVLGGDHSLAIGSLHGHLKASPNACVVWVDAHADINPPLASPSGNIHGMPVAYVMKETQEYIPERQPGFSWLSPCLSAKDIVYIALRDIDPAETKLMNDLNISCYTMQDVDNLGISTVINEALRAVNQNMDRPIHLSFDIDALDPTVAPSTGTAVPGGLSLREGMFIAETIYKTGKLEVLDLVEVNPSLGNAEDNKLTSHAAEQVILSAYGRNRKGNTPKDYVIPRPPADCA